MIIATIVIIIVMIIVILIDSFRLPPRGTLPPPPGAHADAAPQATTRGSADASKCAFRPPTRGSAGSADAPAGAPAGATFHELLAKFRKEEPLLADQGGFTKQPPEVECIREQRIQLVT